ncbi:protein FAR1-RELATED SEQUENCE 5-like [Hevea brasiliensis]|uniref:protein FAR1-RELATED SEQUENCE 5-like n=1 Tax=Hevea brasiliensis TaxID=3981 RepID=UPI0025DDF04D|nr:protein FAR1-RELATED SEQUENCE 5-like [Hevea brasiliensis]
MINAGISTKHAYAYLSKEVGGSECVGFTKRDCYNYVNKQKMVLIEAGDSQSLINHFKHRMSGDAMYVYTVQVDQENRMTNFFWRDGRSRIDYDCFGDVVVFDTTYRTNRYNLICAPFVVVNHHWQNCMFGCAFLLDETTDSFIWLFTSFLESMGGKAPKTIITDQDQAISNVIAKVFPNTRHQLCLWHISKNAPSHLGSYNSNPEFRRLFYKCLQGCETEAEFQATWDKMIDEFSGLRNHKWLNNLYKIREKWCMALNNDVFSGGFKSSQRSESTNNVLNGIANKSISLTKFVLSFEDVVARWRSEEASEDYNCKKGLPSLAIRNSGILNHAAKVYTNKIFKLFQNELLNGIATNWSEIACHDNVYSFEVVGEWGNSRTRTVHFNASTMDISCTCKKFQSMGLLCSHALKIFIVKNVTKIPDNYILRRWTKDAKKRMIEYVQGESHANDEETATIFHNNLMKLSYDIIMRSQGNEATRQFCRDALRKLDIDINRELTRLQLSENDATTENQIIDSFNEDDESDPILDPPRVKRKGVSNARLKGHFEKRKTKARKESKNSGKIMQSNVKESSQIGSERSSQYACSILVGGREVFPKHHITFFSILVTVYATVHAVKKVNFYIFSAILG